MNDTFHITLATCEIQGCQLSAPHHAYPNGMALSRNDGHDERKTWMQHTRPGKLT